MKPKIPFRDDFGESIGDQSVQRVGLLSLSRRSFWQYVRGDRSAVRGLGRGPCHGSARHTYWLINIMHNTSKSNGREVYGAHDDLIIKMKEG
jgi:hypothetical protein